MTFNQISSNLFEVFCQVGENKKSELSVNGQMLNLFFFFTCLSHRVTQEDLSSAVGDLKASCPGESAVPTHISLGFTQE